MPGLGDYISSEKNAAEIKSAIAVMRAKLTDAISNGSFQRAGELAYGRIPELEKELKDIEASDILTRTR